VTISGSGGVTLSSDVDVRGFPAGSAVISSAAGGVQLRKTRAEGGGGSVTVKAAGNLTARKFISVKGGSGTIALTAGDAGAIVTKALHAEGIPGGTVAAVGGSVDTKAIKVGGSSGGVVTMTATSGNLAVSNVDGVGKTGMGATVTMDSAFGLSVPGGVRLKGDTVGGTARFTAAGDLSLGHGSSTAFDVRGASGGTIDGHAAGNLTAAGKYSASTGGCVGLSAGGTLDTTGATFDVSLTTMCP